LDSIRFLWHSQNHPIYRILIEYFEFLKNNADPVLLNVVMLAQSNLQKEDPTSGQSIDFRLEELNRSIQRLLSDGIPTAEQWEEVYQNHDLYIQNRKNWFSSAGLVDHKDSKSSSYRSAERFANEIGAVRKLFRDSGYLTSDVFSSIDGVHLNPELLDVVNTGENIRFENLKKVHEAASFFVLSKSSRRVYVTSTEKSSPKKTLEQMRLEIEISLDNMPDLELREKWRTLWTGYNETNTIESAEKFMENLRTCNYQ